MSSTDDVRRDIDRVRGDLGQTLEELSDRVAPAKVVARTKENLAEKVEEVKEKVNPARVARRQGDKLRDGFRHMMGFGDGQDRDDRRGLPQGDGSGYGAAPGTDLTGRAGDAARSALGTLQDAPHAARQRAEGNPMAAGLLTFAAGFLLASILPPTEKEQQLTDRVREGIRPIAQEATETGKQIAQQLGQSAQQSLEQVKQTASEATERVKAEAESSVGELKAEAVGTANEIKDEVEGAAEDIRGHAESVVAQTKDDISDPPPAPPVRQPRPRTPRIYGS